MRAKSKYEVRIRSEARVCSELYLNRFCPAYDCETLKTRVKLNLNFTRPHAITYLQICNGIKVETFGKRNSCYCIDCL